MSVTTSLLLVLAAALAVGCGSAPVLLASPAADPDTVESALKARISAQGGTASDFAQLAKVKMARGQLAAAQSLAQRAIGLDERHPAVLVVAARVAARVGNRAVACSYYTRAASLDPTMKSAI